jgi:hypothetical protein
MARQVTVAKCNGVAPCPPRSLSPPLPARAAPVQNAPTAARPCTRGRLRATRQPVEESSCHNPAQQPFAPPLCSNTALLPGYYVAGNPCATRAPAAPAGWQPAGVKSATAPQLCGAVRPLHGLRSPRHPHSCGARAEPRQAGGGCGLVCAGLGAFEKALTCHHNCRNAHWLLTLRRGAPRGADGRGALTRDAQEGVAYRSLGPKHTNNRRYPQSGHALRGCVVSTGNSQIDVARLHMYAPNPHQRVFSASLLLPAAACSILQS